MPALAHRTSPEPLPAAGLSDLLDAYAFALVEVVVALGVVAFALVGIIGLFPLAIRTNLECQRETRATQIAQMVLADLRVNSSSRRFCLAGPAQPAARLDLDADGGAVFLAFSEQGKAHTNAVTADDFAAGCDGVAYLVGLRVETNTGVAGLSLVEATIETPAAARSDNRSKFRFVTHMSYQEEF